MTCYDRGKTEVSSRLWFQVAAFVSYLNGLLWVVVISDPFMAAEDSAPKHIYP